MASSTAYLIRASQGSPGQLYLNSYSRDAYVKALEAAGYTGIRSLSKVKLFQMVKSAGIKMVPTWHQ